MRLPRVIALLLRAFIIAGLLAFQSAMPAQASGNMPDCLAMQHMSDVTVAAMHDAAMPDKAPAKAPSNGNPCPFATICGMTGLVIAAPETVGSPVSSPVALSRLILDDRIADGIAPSPLAPPPRA
jgi:hypothetical protein